MHGRGNATVQFGEGDMNQNDMDRYYWRTGQRWSGDSRPPNEPVAKITGWTVILLGVSFLVTIAGLILLR